MASIEPRHFVDALPSPPPLSQRGANPQVGMPLRPKQKKPAHTAPVFHSNSSIPQRKFFSLRISPTASVSVRINSQISDQAGTDSPSTGGSGAVHRPSE